MDTTANATVNHNESVSGDGSLKFLSKDEAWERADKNNNILIMSPEEAQIFFLEEDGIEELLKDKLKEKYKQLQEQEG